MDHIDNRLDVAIAQLAESHDTPLEIIQKLAAAIPVLAIADALAEHFLNRNRYERIVETFLIFQAEIEALKKECVGDRQRLEAVSNYPKSPEFAEAVITAAEEAARSTNARKIKRLAVALANSCDPSIEPPNSDDLTSFIHDVSQLSEGDIQILGKLATTPWFAFPFAQGSEKSSQPESPLRWMISEAEREKLLTDDFYSYCFRLVGFGLAAQILHNSPNVGAGEPFFRLTNRGRRLVVLLKQRT